ncbi:WD40 repeat-like protein [Aaosphaeria arxii CBS 175.79]|uniref:WD40 repeat-like protein n=1 Tax=Aaosphaeria arxii CBS 175.79 TaxID=1450172 RepID=A0A6A5Y9G9_9PLEO|nr:WD40 repeat-like protein [Aaosphaeria arxii CBS 175.79]KAF2021391.1 WD40 repeat-like protein [Aaosphaeria arxii CBS 175.79]
MDETMSDAMDNGHEEAENEAAEQKVINEEYKIWKKNSVFLYDLMYGRALEWPSLTAQWLPDKKPIEGTNMSQHRIILGTHTSGQAQNYLQIAHIEIPDFKYPDLSEYDEQKGEVGGHGNAKKPFDFTINQKINHPSEVNKARYQPQNPDIIASLCTDGRVLIFDRSKHPLQPNKDGSIKFEAELIGHNKEGFGLSWSPLKEGHLVTGNEDTTVRTWDLKAGYAKNKTSIEATATYTMHSATVNDVQYHPTIDFLIGTASDDLTWRIIDTRMESHKTAMRTKEAAHQDSVNCIAFHPGIDHTLATGSADHKVGLWDLRNTEKKIHELNGHRADVMNLQWHPHDSAILASSSNDRRICMWDLSKIGDEQTPEEEEDGPPELLFMHGGFTNRICEFDWNKNDDWVMLATAEDNQMQIFRPSRKIVEPLPKDVSRGEVSD